MESEEQSTEQDPTEVPEDHPSQQSVERDRVEQERKLSSPELAEGGEAGTQSEEGEQPSTLSDEEQKEQQQREQQAQEQQEGQQRSGKRRS